MKADLPKNYSPSDDEPYMSPNQLEYFRQKLLHWLNQLVLEVTDISKRIKEKSLREPDVVDQGALEAHKAVELRTRNRYIKLIYKIDDALERIKKGTYGYCEETGKEIGIKRLEVRPIARFSIEAQERHEQMERRQRAGHRKRELVKGVGNDESSPN
ncbi:MAG: RNA polymerase-binding protein DksA [Deltaproteobacteria bacterium]|nr:MAG: RNA polymerase-binding protein DksA [Deltaproteobacteria bacterium]